MSKVRVMNEGSQIHTVAGLLDRGENELAADAWLAMKEMSQVKRRLEVGTVKEMGASSEPVVPTEEAPDEEAPDEKDLEGTEL